MCPGSSSQDPIPPRRRITIRFEDDALRQRSENNAHALLISATSPESATSSNASLLAKKALKYRRHLHRVRGVDVTAPTFDASKFLGVEWCKTPCLKAYCEGDH